RDERRPGHDGRGRWTGDSARRAALRQDPRRRGSGPDRPAGGVRPAGVVAGRTPDDLDASAAGSDYAAQAAAVSASGPATGAPSPARVTWMHSPGHSFAASITSRR